MFSPFTVFFLYLPYIALLFAVALWVERGSARSRRLSRSPWVYSLSLTIYCTAWTFYGNIETAVNSSLLFLSLYFGPLLSATLWWFLLRKMVLLKNRYRVTSIADFISIRYGKSQAVAALITVSALAGAMPYIAIQIKAIHSTFQFITTPGSPAEHWIYNQAGLVTVLLMCVFTIVFGVRRLDPTERHEGMITAVAIESVVKLIAFLAVGFFVTFCLYDGFGDLLETIHITKLPYAKIFSLSGDEKPDYLLWATYLIISMSAVLFLPRQFHVAVVENADERHIGTAIWVFPLYLLLISLFMVPIALSGLAAGMPASWADTFVLRLPLNNGQRWLSLLVFIGGVSAAMSMVMILSMTLSTMITNHLLLPLIAGIGPLGFLRRRLLHCRWVAVTAVIGTGYWFERELGTSHALGSMGVMSFSATLQFAPPLLLGLYWRGASAKGALIGHGAGMAIWLYTSLLPAFVKSGWLPQSLLENGPWGLGVLRPEALFGLTSLPPLTHTVFWSLLVNTGLMVLCSVFCKTSEEEKAMAWEFVEATQTEKPPKKPEAGKATIVTLSERLPVLRQLLCEYLPPETVEQALAKSKDNAGLSGKDQASVIELST